MKKIILGEPLLKLDSVDSTNNYAAALLAKGTAKDGTVILSAYQTRGKGQGSNTWISGAGENLLFSIILKPQSFPADMQFFLSMSISWGIAGFLETLVRPVQIKWPNDILINNKKVAGILIENTVSGMNLNTSVIGIGLNVNQDAFPEGITNATSLKLESDREFDLDHTLENLTGWLNTCLNSLYEEKYGVVKVNYLNRLWLLNKWANYSDAGGKFEGRITDVTDSGELMVLQRNGKIRNYGFKEITFNNML
ncbi:MAG: biotin--[acetyl-CoA-carboxylase] ligase [Bacteroidales bacterium]|nr:biotin--[acetyl-CoA-carboxylase] ligase [Bacteroidales bacterium]